MSYLRKLWQLHTAAGAVPILEGSSFGFDRSWAPQGAGRLVLPLDHPGAATLVEYARTPLRLVAELYASDKGATLGSSTFGATTLGAGTWPVVASTPYAPAGAAAQADYQRVAWQVYPRRIRRDHVARTLMLEVATAELLLFEARNGGKPWMPRPTGPGATYRVTDVLLELSRYVGVSLRIEHQNVTLPRGEVEPWLPGESAWAWFDRLRMQAQLSYRLDPTLNRIRFVAATANVLGAVPRDWLDRQDDVGGGRTDMTAYADAVEVLWQWRDRAGNDLEQRDVALAPGVASWRDARAWATFTMPRSPIPGWAAARVAQLYRWRNLTTVTLPLDATTLVDLNSGRGLAAQSLEYAIGDEPTVTMTLITED